MGIENILTAVLHADELNTELTEEFGKEIYHYHLHVIAIPVVLKEIKYSKRCKDKSLVSKTKEVIHQVRHSKKWKSEQAVDGNGTPIYDEKGKPILIKSYSLLQDRFFQYMFDNGYRGFIRGAKESTSEHLENLDFKIKKDKERLKEISSKIEEKEIDELNSRISNLRAGIEKWKSLYDELAEKTKYYFHAIKLAPQRVADFFKSLFDKEKQDE